MSVRTVRYEIEVWRGRWERRWAHEASIDKCLGRIRTHGGKDESFRIIKVITEETRETVWSEEKDE